MYHKQLSKPIAQQSFGGDIGSVPAASGPAAAKPTPFVSAVCWKPRSHTLLAANSEGTVDVFELSG